jgi:hypothetical protein
MRGARRESMRRNNSLRFRAYAPISASRDIIKLCPCRTPPSPRPSPPKPPEEGQRECRRRAPFFHMLERGGLGRFLDLVFTEVDRGLTRATVRRHK